MLYNNDNIAYKFIIFNKNLLKIIIKLIMGNIFMLKRDIAWVWETALQFMYDDQYLLSLDRLFRENKVRRVLDCSCGVGFPAIGLKERGYDVVCADADEKMLRRFYRNCLSRGVKIEARKLRWEELSSNFAEEFDCVLCRGNSLPYAVSWVDSKADVTKALPEIEKALKNMFAVLKPGGILYVDSTPREALTPRHTAFVERFGCMKINGKTIEMVWHMKHDLVNKVREWSPEITIRSGNSCIIEKVKAHYLGCHLSHRELLGLMEKVGFGRIEKYREIPGEDNYDVFVGHKVV
jgi:2-polyprenyl-3-methyl-5-hydroxy-6-metoxy-1,4-benzoquinol methylase